MDIFKVVSDWLKETLLSMGIGADAAQWGKNIILLIIVLALAWLANYVAKQIIIAILKKWVKRSKTKWDDIIMEKQVFTLLSHLAPAIVFYLSAGAALEDYPDYQHFAYALINIYLVLIFVLVLDAFFNAVNAIYNTYKVSKDRPIKGYVQLVKIIVYFIGGIIVLSVILNKTPVYFLSGLGALAAVLMLVFKDSILGLVAGIQLTSNNMVKIGDWITMPSQNADGTVIELSLNTVKVQNFDKTIVSIPVYAMVTNSFTNWRGMEESGGRRIKRSINIDMKSVKFCDDRMVEKFKKIKHLKEYVENKEKELKEHNQQEGVDDSVLVNGRRMTNIGTFRAYLENYLKNHPKIHMEMTFLVRQLQPGPEGIPIELYVFSNDQAWARYEAIQADIFDHILAVISEFELSVYQQPTGDDFNKLAK